MEPFAWKAILPVLLSIVRLPDELPLITVLVFDCANVSAPCNVIGVEVDAPLDVTLANVSVSV